MSDARVDREGDDASAEMAATAGENDDLVGRLAEEYLDRLHGGQRVDRDALLAEHPSIASELTRRINTLERLFAATRSVDAQENAAVVRCPYCGTGVELADADPPRDVSCPGCGSTFRVDREARRSRVVTAPESIGRFQVLLVLGSGAFGTVYQAYDAELDRMVAVKVPRAGVLYGPEEEERFLREARSAAQLHHPRIVPVHEIGNERGVPYIVSEFVESRTLAEIISEERPSFRASAELVATVAEALDYAHRAKVVHRDIKPQNILMDAGGQPHVSDFGLARRDDEEVTVTLDGQILGTPAYMAPEQATGDHAHVGPRSDVYSLGVILYELLTGHLPFRGSKSRVLHQVIHDEPRPPRSLNDHVPRDLETICLKAMAKDAARRYGSAQAFADDLRRSLRGEPIQARPIGRIERVVRWTRRNRLVAALAFSVAASLVAGTIVASALAVRASLARDDARAQLSRLNVASGLRLMNSGDLLGSLPWFAEAARIDGDHPGRRASHGLRIDSVLDRCPRLVGYWFHPGPGQRVEFSARGDRLLVVSGGRATLRSPYDPGIAIDLEYGEDVRYAAFSGDGERVLTTGGDAVRVWGTASGEAVGAALPGCAPGRRAAFGPQGTVVAAACGDGVARIWNLSGTGSASATPVRELDHGPSLGIVEFSPDGRVVVTAGDDGRVQLWEWADGRRLHSVLQHTAGIRYVAFSPDGALLATASRDASAIVWNVATGEAVGLPLYHRNTVERVTFSPDGARLVTASIDGTAVVWDPRTGRKILGPYQHALGLMMVAYTEDGRRILIGSYEGTVWIRDALSGKLVAPPLHHGGQIVGAALHPDGRLVATIARDGSVRLWDLARGGPTSVASSSVGGINHAALGPDGTILAVADGLGGVRVFETATQLPRPFVLRHTSAVACVAIAPDSRHLATASSDGAVRIWDVATGAEVGPPLEHPKAVVWVGFSPDGDRVATAAADAAYLWSLGTERTLVRTFEHPARVHHVVFDSSGQRLATSCQDGAARVSDLASAGEPRLVLRHKGAVRRAAFSPDGRYIASGGGDHAGRCWDADSGRPLAVLQHTSYVFDVVFSPDSSRVLTVSEDATLRIADPRTGRLLAPELRHQNPVLHASFSADGLRVVSASDDGTARIWDALTGEQLTPPLEHRTTVLFAFFSPDGRQVVTASGDGRLGFWTLPATARSVDNALSAGLLLAGRQQDEAGGLVTASSTDVRSIWKSLQERETNLFAVSPDEVAAWEEREAFDCEAAGDWSAAAHRMDRLIELEPRRAAHFVRRGEAFAMLGRYALAVDDFRRALEIDGADVERGQIGWAEERVIYYLAFALLGVGDTEGFRRTCDTLLASCGSSRVPEVANLIAWSAAVVPGARTDLARAEELARLAVSRSANESSFRNTLAAVLCRRGKFAEAVEELEHCVRLRRNEGGPGDWVLLALAYQGLGDAAAARRWLEEFETWRAGADPRPAAASTRLAWTDGIAVEVFRQEAARLIRAR